MASQSTQWNKLNLLLDKLFDLPEEQRAAAIRTVRNDDAALAQRAESFLRTASLGDTAATSASSLAPNLLAEFASEDIKVHIGEQLGPYKITEAISRGGMGLVYRAERTDGSYDQIVAIKLLPTSIAGERSRALFERERQLLGRLEHPNIARIIDAGATENDVPYFVMELVDGERIDEYVRAHSETQKNILSLFLRLCDAVAYCHRSMVVHGDIKPDNVLVADGRLRLVDFGIGQLLDDVENSDDVNRVIAFSPGYTSPEQEKGEPPTVASDIYSLGAVLRKLVDVGDKTAFDLRAIIECCLYDDPFRRYPSVDALRSDIRAYLSNYPVRARAPTRRYGSQKFIQRNKLLVGSTIAALLSLAVGLGMTFWQFQAAKTEALRAEQSNKFLVSLFENANPRVAGESDVSLRQVIDDAAARVATELEHDPSLRNEIHFLLGNAYSGIGEFDKAFEFHKKALSFFRSQYSGPHIEIVKAQNALGDDHRKRGEYDSAQALHRDAIEQLSKLGLAVSTQAYQSWTYLGHSVNRSDPDAVGEIMARAHEINLQINSDNPAALTRSLGNIAIGYRATRDIEQSAHYGELALSMAEENGERAAPDILSIRCNLALDYGTLGRYVKAREAQLECNELTARRYGPESAANVANLNNLGALDISSGRLREAEKTYVEALSIAETKMPPMSIARLAVEINYAVVNWHSGRAAEAEASLRDILVRMEESVGADHPAAGRVRGLLGRVVFEQGDARTAQNYIENSLPGLTPYWRSDALLWRAEVALALGQENAALEYATESLAIRREIPHFLEWRIAEAEWVLALATDNEELLEHARNIFRQELPAEHFRRKASMTTR